MAKEYGEWFGFDSPVKEQENDAIVILVDYSKHEHSKITSILYGLLKRKGLYEFAKQGIESRDGNLSVLDNETFIHYIFSADQVRAATA